MRVVIIKEGKAWGLHLFLLGFLLRPREVSSLSLRKSAAVARAPEGYEADDLLCMHGTKNEKPFKQSWCVDWLKCIKEKAVMQVDKVMEAWGPADCEQYCGVNPATNPLEGQFLLLQGTHRSGAGASRDDPEEEDEEEDDEEEKEQCMKSCTNFQKSLSTCVGTIMFEPGKLAVMGKKKHNGPPPDEICTVKDTPCMPDLPIKMQRCHAAHTKRRLQGAENAERLFAGFDMETCKNILKDYDDCKECPQLKQAGGTAYTTFVGGCMDQLNAYWQATHPRAGKHAIPGATGCTVHG